MQSGSLYCPVGVFNNYLTTLVKMLLLLYVYMGFIIVFRVFASMNQPLLL